MNTTPINGNDLIELGFAQGEIVGIALKINRKRTGLKREEMLEQYKLVLKTPELYIDSKIFSPLAIALIKKANEKLNRTEGETHRDAVIGAGERLRCPGHQIQQTEPARGRRTGLGISSSDMANGCCHRHSTITSGTRPCPGRCPSWTCSGGVRGERDVSNSEVRACRRPSPRLPAPPVSLRRSALP